MSASNGAVSRPAEQVCRPGALAAQVDHEIGWAVAGSALDSTLVAFPFGKPVSTFPGNALTGCGVVLHPAAMRRCYPGARTTRIGGIDADRIQFAIERTTGVAGCPHKPRRRGRGGRLRLCGAERSY